MSSSRELGLENSGLDEQLAVAQWLDLHSLCRLERVSKSMRRLARHKSLYVKLRRFTIRLWVEGGSQKICHDFTTDIPIIGLKVGCPLWHYMLCMKGELCHKILPEKEASEIGSGLLRHVLERGARLTSLEILAQENNMGLHRGLEQGLLEAIQSALKEWDVKLTSLVINCGFSQALMLLKASLLTSQAGTLETVVLGPLDAGWSTSAGELLEGLGSPAFGALKHLVLHAWTAEGLEACLGPLWGQLELFVLGLGKEKELICLEEKAAELEALAKAAGSRLRRRTEAHHVSLIGYGFLRPVHPGKPRRVVLAAEGLDESALAFGPLHTVHLLND